LNSFLSILFLLFVLLKFINGLNQSVPVESRAQSQEEVISVHGFNPEGLQLLFVNAAGT